MNYSPENIDPSGVTTVTFEEQIDSSSNHDISAEVDECVDDECGEDPLPFSTYCIDHFPTNTVQNITEIDPNHGGSPCPNCGYCPHCGRRDRRGTFPPYETVWL